MRKNVSNEEKEIWIQRYLNGETARSIWKDYQQYNETTVSRTIKNAGISRGKGHRKEKDDIKEEVLRRYVDEKYATFTSLAKEYNLSDRTISSWIKQAGIPKKQNSGTISHCNEDYFETINTPNKAYLLGFITADGAVTGKHQEPTCCSIEVKDTDKDVILFAKQEINPESTITICDYKQKHNVRVSFNSKKLCSDLKKYGIIQNKSLVLEEVPIKLIPKEMLPFYFRGLIDGDGCVHKNGSVSIYSGSKNFITSVQNVLISEVGLTRLSIYHGTSYFITWSSKKDREKLFNYLYSNLNDTFYYIRKYSRLYNSLYDNTEVNNQIAQG